jgi:hypothetical protein
MSNEETNEVVDLGSISKDEFELSIAVDPEAGQDEGIGGREVS